MSADEKRTDCFKDSRQMFLKVQCMQGLNYSEGNQLNGNIYQKPFSKVTQTRKSFLENVAKI